MSNEALPGRAALALSASSPHRGCMILKTVTAREIQQLDKMAITNIGIPSLVLMENAGRLVSEEVLQHLSLKKKSKSTVSVVCGIGHNAGDGLVCARYLMHRGVETKIFLIGNPQSLKADATINYQILKNLKVPLNKIPGNIRSLKKDLKQSTIIVDAIFGVGLNREISDPFKSVIETINEAHRFVIAIDIPSGLDATTGKIYGVCIRASLTLTFTYPKKGFFLREGPQHAGKIIVADIGIPPKILQRSN